MKISADVIPSLIDAVKITLEEQLAAYEQEGADQDDLYDPNDLVLFEWFVKPVLEDSMATGCDSKDMTYKGFGLMVGLIPWYLNTRSDALTRAVYGKMAKIYYTYMIEDVLEYVEGCNSKYLWENIERINREIEFCLLIEDAAERQ